MMQEGEFVKQKQEIIKLKQELDEFYKHKDKEYKENKNELLSLDKQIQTKLSQIEKTKQDNEKILKEIKLQINSKAMTLYGKMKLKIVKNILQEKIDNGEINDVFDIIVRLKDKRVMNLLKKFDTQISTTLMDKLNNYKTNKEKNDG
jgi:predicted RNase H-like nuclease (RuvC/YqgF family)